MVHAGFGAYNEAVPVTSVPVMSIYCINISGVSLSLWTLPVATRWTWWTCPLDKTQRMRSLGSTPAAIRGYVASDWSARFLVGCATLALNVCIGPGRTANLLLTSFRQRVSVAIQRLLIHAYMPKLYNQSKLCSASPPTTDLLSSAS